jgi:hypothetical protein
MESSSTNIDQFKEALTTVSLPFSALAKEGFLSEYVHCGHTNPDGKETEVYAPEVLEPGMYSLLEANEE